MPADRLLHPRLGHSEKVTQLNDFDFRVWAQFILSADDFGVMRYDPRKVKADNDVIGRRPDKVVMKSLERCAHLGLVHPFEHQGQAYLHQRDWQDWQKLTYPGKTILPKPSPEALAACSGDTRHLFTVHPGGKKVPVRIPGNFQNFPENSENVSGNFLASRARVPAKRLTANGIGLTANGSEESARETNGPPLDVEWAQFVAAYPSEGRTSSRLAQERFLSARSAGVTLASMLEALDNHNASARWLDGKIPNLTKWLEERRWEQRLPAPKKPAGGRTGAAPAGKYDGIELPDED
jgi:hypothetical protein